MRLRERDINKHTQDIQREMKYIGGLGEKALAVLWRTIMREGVFPFICRLIIGINPHKTGWMWVGCGYM